MTENRLRLWTFWLASGFVVRENGPTNEAAPGARSVNCEQESQGLADATEERD